MSYHFGVGTLTLLRDLLITGGAATTGSSGAPASNVQVSSGLVMIDGVTATLSAQSAAYTLAGATGTGLLLYAYIAAGSTTTATLAIVTAAHPLNTASNLPTSICPLAKFSFGTGADSISTIAAWSGGSASQVIAKVQNVSINLSYETADMRGGGDVFPVDRQFFDGKAEGSFEFADQTATQFLMFGGIYASAGAASGTWTLSGTSKPEVCSLVFQNVTNGVTATYTLHRTHLTQSSNDMSRTDYLMPSYSFVSKANNAGTVLTVQQ